jgi:apolipoprotein B
VHKKELADYASLGQAHPKDSDNCLSFWLQVRGILLQSFVDGTSPVEKRLAAYLMLMRQPSSSDVNKIVQLLPWERNEQVKNFVASHIANILNSEELYIEE